MIPTTVNFLVRKRGVIAGTFIGGVSSVSALVAINLEKEMTKTSLANLAINPLVGFAVGRSLFIGNPSLFAAIASHFNNLRNRPTTSDAWVKTSYTRLCMTSYNQLCMASLRSGAKFGAVVGIGYHYLAFVGMYFLGKIGRTDKEYVELMRNCATSFVPYVIGGAIIGSVGTTAVAGIGASRLLW